ncbi:NUMOD4 motif-containing HNH endonuclease [Sphingobium xenophagum]|nr:NUMOD4 motif-containing HNH endonuclease [Sphingobium xenophagum]
MNALAQIVAGEGLNWRPIPGFPDYIVSSNGDIVRIRKDIRGHSLSGAPLKSSPNKSGYHGLTLTNAGVRSSVRVNRIVCEAFHGPAPSPKHHAAHNDGDRSNNSEGNLRWATAVENEQDKREHGTAGIGDRHWSKSQPEKRARGEGHGRAKLTAEDVRRIRLDGRKQREIAASFGVTQRVIWMVKAGKTWGHVA